MLTKMYLMLVTVTEIMQLFEIKDLTQKSEGNKVARNDVNTLTTKFQVSSSKTVGGNRFLVSKFRILR